MRTPAATRRASTPTGFHWVPAHAAQCGRGRGRLYEAMVATLHHRPRFDLHHSVLIVRWNGHAFAIEMAPVWAVHASDRGVTAEGPVGMPSWGRARVFRYEIRCWPDGTLPDVAAAVDSPRRVSTDETKA